MGMVWVGESDGGKRGWRITIKSRMFEATERRVGTHAPYKVMYVCSSYMIDQVNGRRMCYRDFGLHGLISLVWK